VPNYRRLPRRNEDPPRNGRTFASEKRRKFQRLRSNIAVPKLCGDGRRKVDFMKKCSNFAATAHL